MTSDSVSLFSFDAVKLTSMFQLVSTNQLRLIRSRPTGCFHAPSQPASQELAQVNQPAGCTAFTHYSPSDLINCTDRVQPNKTYLMSILRGQATRLLELDFGHEAGLQVGDLHDASVLNVDLAHDQVVDG